MVMLYRSVMDNTVQSCDLYALTILLYLAGTKYNCIKNVNVLSDKCDHVKCNIHTLSIAT